MKSLFLLSALTALMVATPSLAQDSVFRVQLDSPIFFSEPLSVDLALSLDFPQNPAVGDSFSTSLLASGGRAPFAFSHSGTLPAGIVRSDDRIDGTFTVGGPYSFSFSVVDDNGKTDEIGPISLTVSEMLAISGYPTTIQATRGQASSIPAPSVLGGTPPYTVAPTSAVPGLTHAADGSFSLTPNGPVASFTMTATDAANRPIVSNSIAVNVSEPLDLSYAQTSHTLRVGSSGTIPAPVVTGGRGTKTLQRWSGGVPSGMTETSGVISGTPTAAGNGTVTFRATDVDARADNATASWTVLPAGAISGINASYSITKGAAFSIPAPTATNTVGTVTWSISGSLPAGLTINSTTGAISGTVANNATSGNGLRLVATDDIGAIQSSPFDISLPLSGMRLSIAGHVYIFEGWTSAPTNIGYISTYGTSSPGVVIYLTTGCANNLYLSLITSGNPAAKSGTFSTTSTNSSCSVINTPAKAAQYWKDRTGKDLPVTIHYVTVGSQQQLLYPGQYTWTYVP